MDWRSGDDFHAPESPDGRNGVALEDLASSSNDPSSSRSNAALLRHFEDRKISRSLAVPTNDIRVRLRLRELAEPTTLFAEANVDRRERLREVLLRERQRRIDARNEAGTSQGDALEEEEDVRSESSGESESEDEEFYTEGSSELLEARRDMAWYSLARAKARIHQQKREATVPLNSLVRRRKHVYEPLKSFTSLGSQPADDRPISMVRFSPDGQQLATGSWSGLVKLWSIPSATLRTELKGHLDKVGGLAWHPRATLGQDEGAVNLVTGGADSKIQLWSLSSKSPLATLEGHAARVARVAFHPSGQYVASASFDGTWRLWSVERRSELLLQEGHSKQVYTVEFQGDGALVASGGLDAIGRLWDLRTGRTAMVLDGHAKEILGTDFHPNGYQVATASGDDTVRIWDMRALKSIYTIPAHKSSVADVRFFRGSDYRRRLASGPFEHGSVTGDKKTMEVDSDQSGAQARGDTGDEEDAAAISATGLFMCTAGYDGTVNIWSSDDWQLLRTLGGGGAGEATGSKVMSCDASSDGQYLASGDWGRTFKLWGAL
ncbi:unnamed protein product [Parajaminaea phylloscopi]